MQCFYSYKRFFHFVFLMIPLFFPYPLYNAAVELLILRSMAFPQEARGLRKAKIFPSFFILLYLLLFFTKQYPSLFELSILFPVFYIKGTRVFRKFTGVVFLVSHTCYL